jgi:hypothetical protein
MATSNSPDSDEKKRTIRASEFLKTGSDLAGKSGKSGHLQESQSQASQPEASPSQEPHENNQSELEQATSLAQEQIKPRSGVVSSTIHYPSKQQTEPETPPAQVPRTSKISATSPAKISATNTAPFKAEKNLKREEHLERMADKIVGIAEGLVMFKTGMLNPQLTPSQKVKLVAQRYPHFFKRFGKIFGGLIPVLYPVLLFLQKLNQKMADRQLIQPVPVPPSAEPQPEMAKMAKTAIPPEPEKISFLELAEKNIVFCDNHKRPLYSLDKLRDKYGRTASEDVIAPHVYAEVHKAFQEVAIKAKGLPTPDSGLFAGIPMESVMENATEREILLFLNYVKRFPRGYTGKNFRITESFAGWVISGTPDD